ncbi:acyltransferase family protein [Ornithinibacillus sp. L9]|uniref:Acyltransferase family protein n=1 Tax=Ornithinibacillus caprae TaxID=2678566 RepID=A0A6N8FF80_9BACI|nr:acyltransferase family protein [Ornithinibacillus caprae]MUK87356.1 acyltransferase family protein [Ornithinibacillus caprae]
MKQQDTLIQKKFRPEIEGVRAVAALLVAIYHIWFGKVSGGVDVFFIVSGFLITTSILSNYQRTGKIVFITYYLNLMKRLIPLGFLVLVLITIASYLFLPQIVWSETIKQLFASALYYENWQLAFNSVDYLAQNNEASPVQHFWAMSLQGQFYLIWPVVMLIAIFLDKYIIKKSFRTSVLMVLITLFTISIIYSIYKTSANQSWAYFDTFARVWEFTLGGILALTIFKVHLKESIAVILGWLGLVIIISTGLLLPVSTVFPGYAALYPITGVILIMISGSNGGRFGVHNILASKPLTSLGGISYGIYLFHWPILVFYYEISEKAEVSFLHGLLIIAVSILLSYIVTSLIEKPIRSVSVQSNRPKVIAIIFAFMIPMLTVNSLWQLEVKSSEVELTNIVFDLEYPGAMVFSQIDDTQMDEGVEVRPNPLQSRQDKPVSYPDGCHQVQGESEVIKCEYGVMDDPEYVIAIVGGSHSAQWLPTLQTISETESIKIINMTKSACRFTTSEDDIEEDCQNWNKKVIPELVELNPDLVFATADIGSTQTIPNGYVEQWKKLEEHNISVFAIRDNAWLNFDPAVCAEENYSNYLECSVDQEDVLPKVGAWDKLDNKPSNVFYYDLSEYFCEDGRCDIVVGNILVYRDSHHITATYARSLAPVLKPYIMNALKEIDK